MSLRNKYGWFIIAGMMVILVQAIIFASIMWGQLTPSEQQVIGRLIEENFIFLFGMGVLFLAVTVFLLDGIIRNYIIPTAKINSEIDIIRTVNPDHRIVTDSSGTVEQLATSINRWADDIQKIQTGMEARITQARADSEVEKNILAEFLTELPQGMVVCNLEGQILLYNKQAKRLLGDTSAASAPTGQASSTRGYVGIGRSIFSVLENAPLAHALDEINLRLERQTDQLSSCFIVNHSDRLLRIEATPVLDHLQTFNGFLLVLDDFTQRLNEDRCLNLFWRNHSRSLRQALIELRASFTKKWRRHAGSDSNRSGDGFV